MFLVSNTIPSFCSLKKSNSNGSIIKLSKTLGLKVWYLGDNAARHVASHGAHLEIGESVEGIIEN